MALKASRSFFHEARISSALFPAFDVALQLFVARKQAEVVGKERFVFQLLVRLNEPFQMQLIGIECVIVGKFNQVFTSATLSFEQGF